VEAVRTCCSDVSVCNYRSHVTMNICSTHPARLTTLPSSLLLM
jgi:hypothetical protein